MPSSPVAESAVAEREHADLLEKPAPKPRRRAPARRRADDADEFDFGGGLGDDGGDAPAKPARKRAAKKTAARKTPAKTARAKADGDAAEKTAARKRPAAKQATRKAPAKKRATKKSTGKKAAEIEDDPLADFGGFGDDDGPPVPINPAATATVRKKPSPTDDLGGGRVSLPKFAAKALQAEQLASVHAPEEKSKKKKTRRGRRNKKDRQPGDAPPHAEAGGEKFAADRKGGGEVVSGVLELHPKGYGFLREAGNNYVAQESDPFVSGALIDRFKLREGVKLIGEIGPGNRGQGPRVKFIEQVDRLEPEDYAAVPAFDTLTPVNPNERITLERDQHTVSTRVMDLLTPLGKGQRALIVAPPRSGKTVLLREMADSISHNHPEVHLIVLLIDERPEEVTEMQRSVDGEVVASSLDHDIESHIRVSQLVIERAKRMAEEGRDVVILLDSITRLARAFNKWTNSGRVTQGGIDIKALDIPKKLFGTARRFEEGGSVTVVGTVLVETGSRGDDVIFQEFKGTGNMELVLSRRLADLRIFPAIDIPQSSTRREELLLDKQTHESVNRLRRSLISLPATQAMEDLARTIQKFETNDEFLRRVLQVM